MAKRKEIPGIDDGDVRSLAYHLWESEGRPEGRQDEFWFAAREQLEQRGRGAAGNVPPSGPG